jgi:hypothetical protein
MEISGKTKDILVEYTRDIFILTIWADQKMKSTIESVEGVREVFEEKGKYTAFVDHRYDLSTVGANVIEEIEKTMSVRYHCIWESFWK